jgi:DNA-binding response OmpR family regulator
MEENVQTRVLVVDDNIEMTELLKVILEPKSYEVFTANTGLDAVELTRQLCPDIVILDLLLPGMDGWQVCQEIRKFSQVPILATSAANMPGMVTRVLDEGADDYLTKPMPASVLIAHMKKLTRRARAEKQANQANMDMRI